METLHFFSGFCLQDEEELFTNYTAKSEYEIAGFSLGAIKAFEEAVKTNKRVDTLTLLSPAFFQDKSEKFKRLQLLHFKKNSEAYIENFLKNTAYPSQTELKPYLKKGSYEELSYLLNYEWDKEKLKTLKQKGIMIKVYLGEKDKIIDSKKAFEFFKEFGMVYYYKEKGHLLCKR